MFHTKLFWRIFTTYALLSILTAGLFMGIQYGQQEQLVVEEIQHELENVALAVASLTEAEFPQEFTTEYDRKFQEIGKQSELRVTLITPDGNVISDTAESPQEMDNHATRPEVLQAKSSGLGSSQRISNTVDMPMMYHARRVGTADNILGYVRVAKRMQYVNGKIATAHQLLWGATVLSCLGVLACTWLIVRRIVHPMHTLQEAAQQMVAGHLYQNIEIPGSDFHFLADSLNTMSHQVGDRIKELEQRRSEISKNRELLETILSTMVEGVVAVDSQQKILFANKAAEPLLDCQSLVAVGRPLLDITRNKQISDAVSTVLKGLPQEELTFQLPRNQIHVVLRANRLPGHPIPGVVLVLHDISELKRLENLRREFVSNVSHELKTPLAAIQAFAETLLEGGALNDQENNRKFVGRISDQADRLHELILDLLKLAQIESGNVTKEMEPVSLSEVIARSCADHLPVAEGKSITLTTIPPDDEGLHILASHEELLTIFENLIGNALKYTPEGGNVTVRWKPQEKSVLIQIIDTGVGIPHDKLVRIFERFYRVDKARSREVGGTGLGLSIVKHLVQQFGGRIEVESQLGAGSTFSLWLPLYLEDAPHGRKTSV